MNAKQRELISDAYVKHLENGYRSDVAGAYNDIKEFFYDLKKTDVRLKQELDQAEKDWEEQ